MLRKGFAPKEEKHFKFLWLVPALLLSALYFLTGCAREGMGSVMRYQCHSVAVRAVQETVLEVLEQQPHAFDRLFMAQKDSSGRLTSVEANTSEINRVELMMAQRLEQRLMLERQRIFYVPAGAIFNWPLVAEAGPRFPMRILRDSYVAAEISTQLRAAGVNQTEMQVFINYTITMNAAIGGYSAPITTRHSFPVMQLLIIGQVPGYFSNR